MNPIPYDMDSMTVAQLKDCAAALVRLWRLQIMDLAPPDKLAETLDVIRKEMLTKWKGKPPVVQDQPVTETDQ